MKNKASRLSFDEVMPQRGHRRVRSSSARLPSVQEVLSKDVNSDQHSALIYDLPHLVVGTEGGSQEVLLSEFARNKTDKIASLRQPSKLTTSRSVFTRTASLRLDDDRKHTERTSSNKLTHLSAYKLKKSQTFAPSSTSSPCDVSKKEFDISSMKQWSLDTQIKNVIFKYSKRKEDDDIIVSLGNSDDEDTIEIFQSDKVVKEGIKARDKRSKSRRRLLKSRNSSKKDIKRGKKENISKLGLTQRGKSDSSDSMQAQESRRNLIAKIHNKWRSKDLSSVPISNSACTEEEILIQSSSNSEFFECKESYRRNCFAGAIGKKPIGMESPSYRRNCFNSFVSTNNMKSSQNESGSISSNNAEGKRNISKEKSTPVKVNVTTRKQNNYEYPLSPVETFDPKSIDTRGGILRLHDNDDDLSVTSNTSSMSHASSHYSQSRALVSTPSSRSLASTPKYNIIQVRQNPERLIASESDNGYASDSASVSSQTSILSTSTYSSVYTDSSSIRDPCARRSRKVQRSKKLSRLGSDGDGDVWIEKLFVSKKSGKKRVYFVSVKTGERVRGEPPSGASHVLYAADLVHRQGTKSSKEPETIVLCK